MSYFATEYTIHFDDTMAYGSHHFLTAFKFQCAARESFLFGERIFDVPGVRDALDEIHLFTSDAYSRNLNPARLGDRIAILLTLEEWQRASARFCYRVMNERGQPICAGFQTLVCADARTGQPVPLPPPLWDAMQALRDIEELHGDESFRDRVLAGGRKLDSLFESEQRETAIHFLAERYPSPKVIASVQNGDTDRRLVDGESSSAHSNADSNADASVAAVTTSEETRVEAWVFSGQGVFDAQLLSDRVTAYSQSTSAARNELDACAAVARQFIQGDVLAIVSGDSKRCRDAVTASPDLSQVALHLQNVLGALLRRSRGHSPGVLMGHSFGEIAAFGVGGCFDLPTGVRIVCERARAIAEHGPPDGGLLVVAADRSSVATEAALLRLHQVVVAGRNHDLQTVVSGPRDQLDRLGEYLRNARIDAMVVPSPTSFHHLSLRTAAMCWLKQLHTLPLKGPSLAVYSPIDRRFVSPHDDIAAALASQFLRPFDLQGAISDVMEAGATTFIDCGSSGSLARIISQAGPAGLDVLGNDDAERAIRQPDSDGAAANPAVPVSRDRVGKIAPRPARSRSGPGTGSTKRNVPEIGIVGQGCLLPGGACSPEQLFQAIMEQRAGIVDQRDFDPHWSEDFYSAQLVPDRSTSHLTGRVNDADIVAPAGMNTEVFQGFPRAQRLLCIALAPCIASLEGADRVWCLIGATADGFEDQDLVSSLRFAEIDPTDRNVDERLDSARSAGQQPHDAIQAVFDYMVRPGLEVVLVDAACASSLYSVALGMQSLELNETDAVIAGGVFCPGPGNSCLFSQFHGTTSTGCRPFDAQADGVVFSEGSACVTLRRVADAERAGLHVSAVLGGVGLSSDGRSSSANVPQTHGQMLALERCYANYEIDRASIRAIEAHGTSTPVGDATELETLRQFYADRSPDLALHSLKGLLGHAGWAAGTASVIAVCEYLRNQIFPVQAGHREPSAALLKARGTVTLPDQPLALPSRKCRVAIDGFGFGGANAHLVLESPEKHDVKRNGSTHAHSDALKPVENLVFVACHQLVPTRSTPGGLRFDRDSLQLSERHVLLPDLADDMDISQLLAVILVDEIIKQMPEFDSACRRETSVVLAQRGKTQRGVEATMRVLAQRLRRNLAGLDECVVALEAACNRARPSGPYTLQCMMPNVAAGRAALQLNLNGPNFVVDSGMNSLESAMRAASLLLRAGDESGTRLVIVTAIDANSSLVGGDTSESTHDDCAAAFAVTTQRHAEQLGLDVVADVDGTIQDCWRESGARDKARTTSQKVQTLLSALARGTNDESVHAHSFAAAEDASATTSKFPIHKPVWVEAPLSSSSAAATRNIPPAIVAVVRADGAQVAELLATLPRHSQRYLTVVVGPEAGEIAAGRGDVRVIPAELDDDGITASALGQIDDFGADIVLAVDWVKSWDLSEALAEMAQDNTLCEFLFLAAQRQVSRLREGHLELRGLFLDTWNGTVHPVSGPLAGLLKSVNREMPAVRVGVHCTRGLSLNDALERVCGERNQTRQEPEIIYDGAVRLARRLRPTTLTTDALPQVDLDAKSVVVATGGARGVTAVMMESLLRDYHCTIVALGRSQLEVGPANTDAAQTERDFYDRFARDFPGASAAEMKNEFEQARARWESHETIQRLKNLGGRVEYMVADVTDSDQIADAMQEIASKYGRIDLLVHGAGVQLSKKLEHRSLAEFRQTFAVKVAGLHNLVAQCFRQSGTTASTHVLTSAYSIFGNDGQHDYGAANEALDRLCGLSRIHDGQNWSSIAWLAWDGIGMTRGSEYQVLARQRGLSGLTAHHGQHIFRAVLDGKTGCANNVPLSDAERIQYQVKTIPPPRIAATGRLLEIRVDLSKMECLQYHKVRRTPTLPGAWILERMVNAGLQLRSDADSLTAVTIQDVTFNRFVRYSCEHEPDIRVVAEETGQGIVVWMVGNVLHPTGIVLSQDLVFAEATLRFEDDATELKPSLHRIDTSNGQGSNQRVSDPYCRGGGSDVELSGPFDCVRDISIGPVGRRARFVPNRVQHHSGFIPALLLDAAWRVGAMYARPGNDELYVPVRIGRLVAPLGFNGRLSSSSNWEIRTTCPRVENGHVRWDRTEVLNEFGALKLVVEDTFATRLK